MKGSYIVRSIITNLYVGSLCLKFKMKLVHALVSLLNDINYEPKTVHVLTTVSYYYSLNISTLVQFKIIQMEPDGAKFITSFQLLMKELAIKFLGVVP
jgi:hypothetical protein